MYVVAVYGHGQITLCVEQNKNNVSDNKVSVNFYIKEN